MDEEDPVLVEHGVAECAEAGEVVGGKHSPGVFDGLGGGGPHLVGDLAEGVAVVVAPDSVEGSAGELGDDLVRAGAVADEVAHAQDGVDALGVDGGEHGADRGEVGVDVGDDGVAGGRGRHGSPPGGAGPGRRWLGSDESSRTPLSQNATHRPHPLQ